MEADIIDAVAEKEQVKEYRISAKLMGSIFELILTHHDKNEANRLLQQGIAEIQRIESLLSEFRTDSITYLLNEAAGSKNIICDEEVFSLIQRCIKISKLSRGAFDITAGPLKKIYKFKNENFVFPGDEVIREALQLTGYEKISLDQITKEVSLSLKDMHISFAAIGKGYAADQVKKMWLREGVSSAVISASGDLTTIGRQRDNKPWNIGIADPGDPEKMVCYIPIENASVATSGDYEQYFTYKGMRYSHNINPLTGSPVKGIKSVSVISPVAELSDALATAVYVMGADTGLHFINQLPDTHCIIIDSRNKIHYSEHINICHEK